MAAAITKVMQLRGRVNNISFVLFKLIDIL